MMACVSVLGCASEKDETGATGTGGAGAAGGTGGAAGVGGTSGAGGGASTTWSVHVVAAGTLPVVANDADGALHSVAETDATGQVDVDVPDGGSVSVLSTRKSNPLDADPIVWIVNTYADVRESTTFRTLPVPSLSPAMIATLELVPDSLPAGTDHVKVWLPCGGQAENAAGDASAPITLNLGFCDDATEYYVVALALDATENALAGALLEHLPATPGSQSHTLSFATPVATASFDALVPNDALGATIRMNAQRDDATYGTAPMIQSEAQVLTPGPVATSFTVLSGYFSRFSVSWRVGTANGSSGRDWASASAPPDDLTFDPTAVAWPAVVSTTPVTAGVRPDVSWSFGASDDPGDCVGSYTYWVRGGSTAIVWLSWQSGALDGKSVFPELPATLDDFLPKESDSLQTRVKNLSTSSSCADLVSVPFDQAWAEISAE